MACADVKDVSWPRAQVGPTASLRTVTNLCSCIFLFEAARNLVKFLNQICQQQKQSSKQQKKCNKTKLVTPAKRPVRIARAMLAHKAHPFGGLSRVKQCQCPKHVKMNEIWKHRSPRYLSSGTFVNAKVETMGKTRCLCTSMSC